VAPVAVTGATGFIGSAVVRELLAQGRDVRALVEPGARTDNLDDLPPKNVERVTVDVCDFERMRRALDGCETLYHLAAIYKVWLPDPAVIYRVNLEGTTATLLAARAAGVKRVVYTSSISAIGLRDDGKPSDETTPFNLFSIANEYILTKYLSERIALQHAAAGLSLVVVNPGFPFGPRDRAPTPTGKIVLAVLRGQVPGYTEGGFSAIDVDDCAKGHVLAEEKGRAGERYVLVNHNVSFKDFFTLVARIAKVRPPTLHFPRALASAVALGMEKYADHVSHEEPRATLKTIQYAQKDAYFDNTKARTELGMPTRPLEETVERAVKFFRETGYANPLGAGGRKDVSRGVQPPEPSAGDAVQYALTDRQKQASRSAMHAALVIRLDRAQASPDELVRVEPAGEGVEDRVEAGFLSASR
jgi:dihydroflavonol-4-reductase